MRPDPTSLGDSSSVSGLLLNGNRRGNPSGSPRCGAKTRSGKPCQAPAMWSKRTGRYTRCRLHGGKSTGPRTLEGLARSKVARLKHGFYSIEKQQQRRGFRLLHRALTSYVRAFEHYSKRVAAGKMEIAEMEQKLRVIELYGDMAAWEYFGLYPWRRNILEDEAAILQF